MLAISIVAAPQGAGAAGDLPQDVALPLGKAMGALVKMCEAGIDSACAGANVLSERSERLRRLSADCADAYRSQCLDLVTAAAELDALARQLARQQAAILPLPVTTSEVGSSAPKTDR